MSLTTNLALLQRFPPNKLTDEVKAAIGTLVQALILLGTKGGVNSGIFTESLKALWPLFPQLTVRAYRPLYLKNAIIRDAIDSESWRANTLNGTYFVTTDIDDVDNLDRFAKRFAKPHPGLIQVFADIGTVPGISLPQFTWLLKAHAKLLEGVVSAEDLRALNTFASKQPGLAIAWVPKPRPITFDDWMAFYSPASGAYYNRAQLDLVYSLTQPQGAKAPIERYRGKHIVMIGAPPRGWSTKEFADSLARVNATVVKQFAAYTTMALYDPKGVDSSKVKEAEKRGITMIPYSDAIEDISNSATASITASYKEGDPEYGDQAELLLTSRAAAAPAVLTKATVQKLRSIITNAIKKHDLPAAWKATGNDAEDLVSQINDICNEFNLRVNETTGEIVKA